MGGWKVSVERRQRTIAVVPAKYEHSNTRTLEGDDKIAICNKTFEHDARDYIRSCDRELRWGLAYLLDSDGR